MAYPDKIDEEAIYLSSGNPLPRDVDAIVKALNHDSFKQAFKFIWGMNTLKGYSLADILRDIMTVVVQVQYPNEVRPCVYRGGRTDARREGGRRRCDLRSIVSLRSVRHTTPRPQHHQHQHPNTTPSFRSSVSTPPSPHQHPLQALTHLYKELADIEYHLAAGASEKLQLGALVGAFCHAREMLSS